MKKEQLVQSKLSQRGKLSISGTLPPGSGKLYGTNPLARYSGDQDPADFAIMSVILQKLTMETHSQEISLAGKTIQKPSEN
ncbi:MAG: hypothetical protein PHO83_03970 [Geobacteraceae bacterium]|nr:hypothetical protein [Geobacteraceae bacterium]